MDTLHAALIFNFAKIWKFNEGSDCGCFTLELATREISFQ